MRTRPTQQYGLYALSRAFPLEPSDLHKLRPAIGTTGGRFSVAAIPVSAGPLEIGELLDRSCRDFRLSVASTLSAARERLIGDDAR